MNDVLWARRHFGAAEMSDQPEPPKYLYAFDPNINKRCVYVIKDGVAISMVTDHRFKYPITKVKTHPDILNQRVYRSRLERARSEDGEAERITLDLLHVGKINLEAYREANECGR